MVRHTKAAARTLTCLAILAIPALTFWNLAVGQTAPQLMVTLGRKLNGVTETSPAVELSWRTFSSGTLQASIAKRIGDAAPPKSLLVRIGNEFRYLLFGAYNSPNFVVGRTGHLITRDEVDEYCSRRPETGTLMARDLSPKLKTIQDYFERRGRVFLFMVTPAKVPHMPEEFDAVHCPNSASDRAAKLPTWMSALSKAGVNHFDAASYVHERKAQYPIPLFPLRALHMSELATAMIAQALTGEINRLAGRGVLPAFTYSYDIAAKARPGYDRDLAELANLLVPRVWYPVPRVTFLPSQPCDFAAGPTVRLALVGSSALNQIADALVPAACLRQVDYYFYLKQMHYRIVDGVISRTMNPDEQEFAPIREADILIVEENESFTVEGQYIPRLADYLGR
jgi:alginate O-acetyltransferase complex protein AlgJ